VKPVAWRSASVQSKRRDQAGITLDVLRAIEAPTLVMAADVDVVRIQHTFELFNAIDDCQLAAIPKTSQFVIIERPALIAN
jgi:pimeloyl-ACP methyl ester carboxylesterase